MSRPQHPALRKLHTTADVHRSRPHLKMLSMDYLTYEKRAEQQGGKNLCRCCSHCLSENLMHILSTCEAYSDIRERVFPQFSSICLHSKFEFWHLVSDSNELTQFILDPTSLNLKHRINSCDPNIENIFKISQDYCYAIHKKRISILAQLKATHSHNHT